MSPPRSIEAGAEQAKPTRAEDVRQERRRKPGSVTGLNLHLNVDKSKLDEKNYHYRFVNDVPGRIQSLETQDYDVAPEMNAKTDGTGLGTVTSQHAGVDKDGKPYGAVLMRKPRWMHEEDMKAKEAPLKATEEAIRRGNVNHKSNDLRGEGVYTPGGVNIIESV